MDDLPDQIRRWAEAAASNARSPVTVEEAIASSVPDPRPSDLRPAGRRRLIMALAATVVVATGIGAAVWPRGGHTQLRSTAARASDPSGPTATVDVQIEPGAGPFVEGFEVGLRFETATGREISSKLWTDTAFAAGASGGLDLYDFVLSQDVPAGEPIVLRAEVTIGEGPPASIPDLDGPLPCHVDLDLSDGDRASVEVTFDAGNACLRLVEIAPSAIPTATTTTDDHASRTSFEGEGEDDHQDFPVNDRGQTYGSIAGTGEEPDLIEAYGDDGEIGYILASDLDGPMPQSPDEALSLPTGPRALPLYASDGLTIIGTYTSGEGAPTQTTASAPG